MFPFLDVKAVYKWNFKWSICIFRRPNQTVCKPLYTIAIVSELERFILKSHFIVSLFKGTQWLQKVSKLKIPSFNNLHQMMTRLESLGNRLFANNWNHCFLLPIIRNATEKMPDCNSSKLPRTETYKCSIKNNIFHIVSWYCLDQFNFSRIS